MHPWKRMSDLHPQRKLQTYSEVSELLNEISEMELFQISDDSSKERESKRAVYYDYKSKQAALEEQKQSY